MSVASQSHDTLSKDRQIQYGGQVNIEYFVESIRRKPVSTKWTFDKMTLRQKAFSTKLSSRRSVVRQSVIYPVTHSHFVSGAPYFAFHKPQTFETLSVHKLNHFRSPLIKPGHCDLPFLKMYDTTSFGG